MKRHGIFRAESFYIRYWVKKSRPRRHVQRGGLGYQTAGQLLMEHSGLLTFLVLQSENRYSERLVQPAIILTISMIYKKNKETQQVACAFGLAEKRRQVLASALALSR